ncbi:SDR family oxidoreductase [Parasphingopyxis algicola]|uniref:SDR family NAD(P)-dependent oxidoreductase n=1 Tax=Parasphingopyxis algicola TaxID=2026624 RepID=UPI0015A1AF9F|nr:SDR family oxidoreductase [Parasphingopyxis algicola]QLC26507.1 SDR family oxidoreductase [Parasphingopyxis algicola]
MTRFDGKRIFVTSADDFMGPAATGIFDGLGADIVASTDPLLTKEDCRAALAAAGKIDILLVNLAADTHLGTSVLDLPEDGWRQCFDLLVHPLHWLVQAALPSMLARRSGKIVVFGSATGLRARALMPAYCAARSAQVGYVRSVGAEVASRNVQINLIAQNFVENEKYFPAERVESDAFKAFLAEHVPVGRLAEAREDIALAAFLASEHADFIAGQAIPFSGGWVQ